MGDWRDTRLAALIDIKHGFAFKGEFFVDDPSNDILVTPGNFAIGGGFQLNKPKFYTGPVPEEYVLSAGDVIVTMTDLSKDADTLGYSAVVPNSQKRFLHNQRIGKVVPKDDQVYLPFIAWVMRTRQYRSEIVGGATGSTVKHTSPSRILSHEFKLPPPPVQQAIASVLDSLGDKIELNRRMNETLEAMARAIFKDWFVNFGPIRAKIEGRAPYLAADIWSLFPDALDEDGRPKGWAERRVEDILELVYGKALKASERIAGPIPVYGSGGITGYHNEALVPGPSIVVGRKGTVGTLYWEDRPLFPIDTVFYVKAKAPLTFCFYHLQTLGLEAMNTDAAVPGLNRSNVYRLPVPWDTNKLPERFDELVTPFRQRIRANSEEIEVLATTRDFLLPKLMSGEVCVKDTEKLVGEAT